MDIPDWLKPRTDGLTVPLAFLAFCLFVGRRFVQPTSLVHPLLLGRQADVGRVRKPGESAVYRNYGTGLSGRLPSRPEYNIATIPDLLRDDFTEERTLWDTKITNSALKARATAFGAGLLQAAELTPKESSVLLLLNDSLEWLIADLGLAIWGVPTTTLTDIVLLNNLIDTHTPSTIIVHQSFLLPLLELYAEFNDGAALTVIVAGDPARKSESYANKTRAKILIWEDVEEFGQTKANADATTLAYSDVYGVTFFGDERGELQGTQLTHSNITAGVAATRVLFPMTNPLSKSDTIVSTHSLATSFGRTILYTALYEGANFSTVESTRLFDRQESSPVLELIRVAQSGTIPPPTILFLKPEHLASLTSAIFNLAKSNLLFSIAHRHKAFNLLNGSFGKDTYWDELVFKSARQNATGKLLNLVRSIAVSGGIVENASVIPARIALSVPIVFVQSHPMVTGPIFASHPLDVQSFPPSEENNKNISHVGPPSVNVEVKLLHVNDEELKSGRDPVGELVIRGPSVGSPLPENSKKLPLDDHWVATGERALVQTNGTFKVFSS